MTNNKEYSNAEVTVFWKPDICIHAAECVKGLSAVFDPNKKPWVNLKNASSKDLIMTIDKCPSGALSYKVMGSLQEENSIKGSVTKLNVLQNGPLIVEGNFELFDAEGNEAETKSKVAICRCGASENKPFCDGSHSKIGFQG